MRDFVRGCTPEFPVRDLAETLAYYRDVLGFKTLWQWKDEYAAVGNGETQVFLCVEESPSAGSAVYFFVDDADAVCAEYKRTGATLLSEPESKPWGMREFTVRDLNGHLLRFGHSEKKIPEIPEFRRGSI